MVQPRATIDGSMTGVPTDMKLNGIKIGGGSHNPPDIANELVVPADALSPQPNTIQPPPVEHLDNTSSYQSMRVNALPFVPLARQQGFQSDVPAHQIDATRSSRSLRGASSTIPECHLANPMGAIFAPNERGNGRGSYPHGALNPMFPPNVSQNIPARAPQDPISSLVTLDEFTLQQMANRQWDLGARSGIHFFPSAGYHSFQEEGPIHPQDIGFGSGRPPTPFGQIYGFQIPNQPTPSRPPATGSRHFSSSGASHRSRRRNKHSQHHRRQRYSGQQDRQEGSQRQTQQSESQETQQHLGQQPDQQQGAQRQTRQSESQETQQHSSQQPEQQQSSQQQTRQSESQNGQQQERDIDFAEVISNLYQYGPHSPRGPVYTPPSNLWQTLHEIYWQAKKDRENQE